MLFIAHLGGGLVIAFDLHRRSVVRTISAPGADPLPAIQPQSAQPSSYTVERPGLRGRLRGDRPGLLNRLRGRFGRTPSSARANHWPPAAADLAQPARGQGAEIDPDHDVRAVQGRQPRCSG